MLIYTYKMHNFVYMPGHKLIHICLQLLFRTFVLVKFIIIPIFRVVIIDFCILALLSFHKNSLLC